MKLTNSQLQAVDDIECSQKHIVIEGYAGTGKTFLLNYLMANVIGNEGIVITAPTHQAKRVISQMTNKPASTIHSVFKIHPDTLEDVMVFDQTKTPDLSKCRWLIIDECSMVGQKLFDIIMNTIPAGIRVIAMGDPAQLQPPDNDIGQLSPFFTDSRFDKVTLKEIVRNSGAIVEVAQDIRNGKNIYDKRNDDQTGVIQYNNVSELLDVYFNKVTCAEDFMRYKFVAYTNKVVNQLNQLIRKEIYNTDEPVVLGEYLVMQEPLVIKEKNEFGESVDCIVLNNGENVRVVDIKPDQSIHVSFAELPTFIVKCHQLTIESIDDIPIEHTINVIYNEGSAKLLQKNYSDAAGLYKKMKQNPSTRNQVKGCWKSFWDIKNLFTDVKPAPACTIHKSQGMTLDDIFFWTQDLAVADEIVKRQLRYVACTRPKNNVHFI